MSNEMGRQVSYPCLLSVSAPGPLMTQRHSVLPRVDVLFMFYSVCWWQLDYSRAPAS